MYVVVRCVLGVGICGNEGRHAANSADFAIGQFRCVESIQRYLSITCCALFRYLHLPHIIHFARFLAPLLLNHGRYNYMRSCKLVLYSFFKNLVLVSTLFYYALYR
jgi:magnesium-transporting ATPase (P-type)